MSLFDLEASFRKAEKRLGEQAQQRRKRSDYGMFRTPEAVMAELERVLGGQEYPGMTNALKELREVCAAQGLRCPSRSTVYKYMQHYRGRGWAIASLPPAVRAALYNLPGDGEVPGEQLAFYCFNYGDLRAVQYAAGLPWLPLYRAYRMRGWRPQSRGLLRAALVARGIPHG
jgi:hypothetical protein